MAEAKASSLTQGIRSAGTARAPVKSGLPLSSPRVLASVGILGGVTLAGEMMLPAGLWSPALHIAVVFLGVWLARPREILVLGGVATWLVFAGAILTLPTSAMTSVREVVGALSEGSGLANRLMVLVGVWALAAALADAKRREAALRARLVQETGRRQATELQMERQHSVPRPEPLPVRVWNEKDLGHEVRTLLNAIIGFSDAAQQELLGQRADDRYKDYLSHINASGWALLGVFEANLASEPLPERTSEPGSRRGPSGDQEDEDDGAAPCVPRAVNQ
jgi:signal transduction histidine kinase